MTTITSDNPKLVYCKNSLTLRNNPSYTWVFELVEAKQSLNYLMDIRQYWSIYPDPAEQQVHFVCYQQPSGQVGLHICVEMFDEMR